MASEAAESELRWKAVFGAVVLNLLLFILVASSDAFQRVHHHWIFPVLAVPLALEWGLAGGVLSAGPAPHAVARGARAGVLSILAFLIFMGLVRHFTILACFGRCSFKLGGAALLAAAVFGGQSRLRDRGFWDKTMSESAALACLLWAVYLPLFGLGVRASALELTFLAAAAALVTLGRGHPATRIVGLALPAVLLVRRLSGEHAIIGLDAGIILASIAAARRSAAATI